MKKVYVILNEQHRLLPDQERLLNERFGDAWEIYHVPADGWTLAEQRKKRDELETADAVIFASPVPYLLKELSFYQGASHMASLENMKVSYGRPEVLVFHTDKREKKELPDGRIISVVAAEGWQLV